MAVTFDAQSAVKTDAITSITLSHTCTGSNRLLLVGTHAYFSSSQTATCTGVTYSGTAMTLVARRRQNGVVSDSVVTELWYLIAPATGANNIVATWSTTTTQSAVNGVSFAGADQTTGINGSQVNSSSTGSTLAVTITSASGDMTCTALGTWWDDGATSSQTIRGTAFGVGDQYGGGGDTAAGAASVTHTWTRAGADDDLSAVVGCNVIQAAGGVTTRRYSLPLMGLG